MAVLSQAPLWTALPAAAVLLWGLWRGMRCLSVARDLADTPLSRLRSVAQGYVAVQGRARWMPGPPIISPLTQTRCAWWWYSIDYERGKQRRHIAGGTSDDLFYLVDASGRCIVDPVGADVEPGLSRRWCGGGEQPGIIPKPGWDSWLTFGPYVYRERLIPLDAIVIARGWYRTQRAVVEGDEQRDLRDLLVQWKQDRRSLLKRFDADRNGEIDLQEWEAARAAALEEVRAQRLNAPAPPDCDVLSKPPDRRAFVLSACPQDTLVRRWRRRGLLALGLAVMGAVYLILRLAPV